MSRLPCEQRRIEKPYAGGEYKVLPSQCAHPHCDRSAVHGHHALPRSYTTSWPTQDWAMIDEQLVPVVIPLCWQHHQDCTDNTARVAWEGGWYWEQLLGKDRTKWVGKIEHPMVWPALGDAGGMGRKAPPAPSDPAEQGFLRSPATSPPVSPNAELQPGTVCPTCGKRLPHEKKEKSPTSKPVGFRVPVDALEDYKAHLGMWKDDLGISKEPFADYKSTLTAVAWCHQNWELVKVDLERRLA